MTEHPTGKHVEPASPASLLLVDDEENILSSLRRLLRRDGYRIHLAGSGLEGLKILEQEDVDVIISDQRMPGMTGTEFLSRARLVRPASVRIVLSGYTELESVTAAINEGSVFRFLTKPWDDEQLRKHITEAVHYKQVEDENRRLQTELLGANRQLKELLDERQRRLAIGEASLHFAHEVMAALPLAVIGVDSESLVVLANEAAQSLFQQHLVGLDATSVLPPALHSVLQGKVLEDFGETRIGKRSLQVVCRRVGTAGQPRGQLFAFFGMENDTNS